MWLLKLISILEVLLLLFTVGFDFETIVICLNIGIRLWYPSSYCPASAVEKGFLPHPFLARFLATIAEYYYYHAQLQAFGLDQQWFTLIIVLGEVVSWIYLLLQSEIFGLYEDTIWTILQLMIWVYTDTKDDFAKHGIVFGFVLYMCFIQLPMLIFTKCTKEPLLKPLYVRYQPQDITTALWWIPSLILQGLTYIYFKKIMK